MATKRLCAVEGCGKPVYGHGWCNGHYHRWKRHGDVKSAVPLGPNRHKKDPHGWLRANAGYLGDECLIWPFCRHDNGYARITIKGASTTASRVMCEMLNGPAPSPEHEAAHSCGNGRGGCVTPKHLRWATTAENAADRTAHGMDCPGMRNGRAKLTDADVLEIRRLRGVARQVDLAARFGVNQAGISSIQLGKKWKNLLPERN